MPLSSCNPSLPRPAGNIPAGFFTPDLSKRKYTMFENAEIISRYTRADAIAEGVLIDVTPTAREAGFKYPVALTATVWAECVAVPPGVVCQDEAGRLWDIVWMLKCAIARANGSEILFSLHVRNDNRERTPPLVRVKAICGPGDDAEPVITVMMPNED
jgi:uncharacterized protein DUF6573